MKYEQFKEICKDLKGRFEQFCNGTSGLPEWKEIAYLQRLKDKQEGKQTISESPKMKPGIIRQGFNFVKSLGKHLADGLKHTSEETKQNRLAVCDSCDKLIKENRRCSECGCYVDIKASWASEKCPIDKWLPEIQENKQKEIKKSCCG